jgi:Outer membrane protein beta-barrel domain
VSKVVQSKVVDAVLSNYVAHAMRECLSISGGADYQPSNRVVVGLFVDGDFTNMSSDLHAIIPENPLEVHGSVGINDKISVGARLGYLFWRASLWYVSAGYTRVDFDNVKVSIQADTNISAAIDVPALSGGFVGVGSETLLTDNISLKAEFRYTDFGSGKLGFPTIDGTNLNDFVNARLSPTMQEGRLSINYRINYAGWTPTLAPQWAADLYARRKRLCRAATIVDPRAVKFDDGRHQLD